MNKNIINYFYQDIAIDLGTANSLVYVRGKGIIINEPSVVALNEKTGQILAIGQEAKRMVGRTPSYIVASRPLVKGVVSDFEITEQMLRYFIQKARGKNWFPHFWPRVIIGIPSGITEVEEKAVRDAARNAGAYQVFLVDEPVASAIGAKMPIQEATGNLIVDIGGGTSEVAVISLGGIVSKISLKTAGDKLNQDIIDYVLEEYNLIIGEQTAEQTKMRIGSAIMPTQNEEMSIRGRNIITGLPEEIVVSSKDIYTAIKKSVDEIILAIKETIEATPPELLADIMTDGIHLAGGGAFLKGLDQLIMKEVKMPTKIIEDPLTVMVRGAGAILESLDSLKEVLAEENNFDPPR
jgi:rod shape-determining protein MreB and related proteins